MTEIRTNVYASHARSLTVLLAQTLNNLQDLGHPVAYYVLATLKNLVPLIRDDKMVRTIIRFNHTFNIVKYY